MKIKDFDLQNLNETSCRLNIDVHIAIHNFAGTFNSSERCDLAICYQDIVHLECQKPVAWDFQLHDFDRSLVIFALCIRMQIVVCGRFARLLFFADWEEYSIKWVARSAQVTFKIMNDPSVSEIVLFAAHHNEAVV
jgi:hypothetical protein